MKENKTKVQDTPVKNKGGYGVLSLMAMIVGIVIGSGIFAKNAGLITSAGSTAMVALTWIVGSIVVISIVIAFIEIITITEIANEQSTTANWGRKLLGIRFGKFIGYYITLVYFPIIIAALFQFASTSFLETVSYTTPTNEWFLSLTATGNEFNYMLAIIGVSFIFMVIIMGINAMTTKPGKYFQNIGTMIKTIPLFFVIIVFIYMISTNVDSIHFYTAAELGNTAPADGMEMLKLVMATIPAVLFAFDGFLLAGALSKESKSPTSFRTAFILSMIFIIIIYITFSIAVLGLGNPEDAFEASYGDYGSITNAVFAVFSEEKAKIISPIINGIITISMLTGVSGCSIASYRSLSDLSANNLVKDPDMKYIRKNRFGISEGSGAAIIGITIFWYLLSIGMDTYLAHEADAALAVADFSSNLIIIVAYFIYAIIIFGALINRFKKEENRVPVKKNILFLPAALFAIISTTIITGFFAYQIFEPIFSDPSDKVAQMKILYTIIFFGMIILLYVYNSIRTWRLKDDFLTKKRVATADYYGELSDEKMIPEELVRERLIQLEKGINNVADIALEYKTKADKLEKELAVVKKPRLKRNQLLKRNRK